MPGGRRAGLLVAASLLLVTGGLQALTIQRIGTGHPARANEVDLGRHETSLFSGSVLGAPPTAAATPPAPVPVKTSAAPTTEATRVAGTPRVTVTATVRPAPVRTPATRAPAPVRRATPRATPRRTESATPKPKPPVSTVITRQGDQLYLYGKPYEFTGIDAYGLATDYGHNAGCDAPTSDSDLDAFFAGLRPDSLVRFWAFQAMAVNPDTKKLDWTGIDRVFAAAAKHHQRLIVTLGDQAGVCDDGHWHDLAWYEGADHTTFDDDGRGLTVMSWWDWVNTIVPRYADSPALGMWEPVNEPEDANCDTGFTGTGCYGNDSCPGGTAEVLRDWFTTVGGLIHTLDPKHLVSAGLLGLGECGQQNEYYGWIAASPGVDVMTIHDYDDTGTWDSALNDRWQRAVAAGKPLVLEEWGDNASDSSGAAGCASRSARALLLSQKLDVVFAHPGMAGMTPWHWEAGGSDCSTEITPGDPAMAVLHDHAL